MASEDEDIDGLDRYQAIVEEILAGRTDGHRCPWCGDGELACRLDDAGRLTIRCPKCGRFFEGTLA
jgi:DNA-directed RNA polymerase subunit RPC12/RpoP